MLEFGGTTTVVFAGEFGGTTTVVLAGGFGLLLLMQPDNKVSVSANADTSSFIIASTWIAVSMSAAILSGTAGREHWPITHLAMRFAAMRLS